MLSSLSPGYIGRHKTSLAIFVATGKFEADEDGKFLYIGNSEING